MLELMVEMGSTLHQPGRFQMTERQIAFLQKANSTDGYPFERGEGTTANSLMRRGLIVRRSVMVERLGEFSVACRWYYFTTDAGRAAIA